MSFIRDIFRTGQNMAADIWNDALEQAAREVEREAMDRKAMNRTTRHLYNLADRIRGLRR